jgi:hypothetical protein
MSILAIFRWQGDPARLLATYDKELESPVPREQSRRQLHVCAEAEDGNDELQGAPALARASRALSGRLASRYR